MDPKDYLLPPQGFDQEEEEKDVAFRTQVAVASLLCEMAHVDDHFDKSEFERIIQLIVHQFHIMDEEAERIRELAEVLIQDKSKVDLALDTINAHFSVEQKKKVSEMASAVAEADGVVDKYEQFFLNYLKGRLGL
ncbi:MAG: TerB family tellurite resistance protein [Bdellovibrionales bacterium]|nr:TerB family tellurite resistance protein [Bdellovibrionales bacterium]